ncbi:MAG TPA: NifB/NifX family molybdenum-iron cluster-binding protein [Ignavibacteria bacterium]
MKAITVKEDNINSPLEDCFGKAKYFCFVEENPDIIEFVLNPGYDLLKGSGKKAVSYLIEKGVEIVISRNYGITVKKILNKHNIQTVIIPSKYKKLSEILQIFKA